ncbi:uncharacterized protein LOC111692560 [Anoplophora glabripennis]|uniref:uncharacterized protein LOC111692560 n=1 Tax=Anoplophora glabripennis TaxID=217634 RepID=UPI000C780BB5|nr:uncharacterized protein LOC111692560 [Anoplophora glabripennis]
MSVKLHRIQIEKLEGTINWISWKFDIDLQLTVNKVAGVVTGSQVRPECGETEDDRKLIREDDEKDAIARYIIGSTVSQEPKQHILTCKNAKQMWDTLHSVYEQRNERRLDLLYTELFTYKKDSKDTIATHVSKLQHIFLQLNEELKHESHELPMSLLLNRVLNTLPNEYLEVKNAWESVPIKERSIAVLTERLRLHGNHGQGCEMSKIDNVALIGKDKRIKCNFCKKLGHIKKNCFKLKRMESKP